MGTTAATKVPPTDRSEGDALTAGPLAVRIGVLWGYPFTLVRKLLLAFGFLVAALLATAWVIGQPTDTAQSLLHLVALALSILISLYVAEVLGVTMRPAPRLRVEALLAALAASCFLMALFCLLLAPSAGSPSVALLCTAPALSGLAIYLQRRWAEVRGVREAVVAGALFTDSRKAALRALSTLRSVAGVALRAVVLPPGVGDRSAVGGLPVFEPSPDLQHLRRLGVQLLLVEGSPQEMQSILAPCAGAGFQVESVPDLVARMQGKVDINGATNITLLSHLTSQAVPWAGQRVVDLVLASLLMVLVLPVLPFVALAIVLESRGPVFFRQQRVGRWGKVFRIVKFRTMHSDAEAESGPVWAQPGDPRVTRLGRFLRHFRIDELPQLWNVIRGDMSLVGPRPERPFFAKRLSASTPLFPVRHCVRPGMTGWAQIRYPYASSAADAQQKLAYDLFYIYNRSLTFYFTVLLETAKVVLFRRGAR